jgi:hypothetical protein
MNGLGPLSLCAAGSGKGHLQKLITSRDKTRLAEDDAQQSWQGTVLSEIVCTFPDQATSERGPEGKDDDMSMTMG